MLCEAPPVLLTVGQSGVCSLPATPRCPSPNIRHAPCCEQGRSGDESRETGRCGLAPPLQKAESAKTTPMTISLLFSFRLEMSQNKVVVFDQGRLKKW